MNEQTINARGHQNVRATHRSTLEVTIDEWLTPAGDCIIGIAANCAPADFDSTFVEQCQSNNAQLTMTLRVGEHTETIHGSGSTELSFKSNRSLVVRTSTFTDDRTVMVEADKSAADIDRELISALRNGGQLHVVMTVNSLD